MQANRFAKLLVAGIAPWVIPATAFCQGAKPAAAKPAALVEALASEEFREREEAQAKLETWANSDPARGMEFLFREYQKPGDPEVHVRVRKVLRGLVVEDHQRNHGEGYMGVRYMELNVPIPGDDQPHTGVQLSDVMEGSPAARAGLERGDIVVALDGLRWTGAGAADAFKSAVRKIKPHTKVELEFLRNGELKKTKVELDVRPLGLPEAAPPMVLLPNGMIAPQVQDPKKLEEEAREEIFSNWLEGKRGKPAAP